MNSIIEFLGLSLVLYRGNKLCNWTVVTLSEERALLVPFSLFAF